jgi:hypothetical protein
MKRLLKAVGLLASADLLADRSPMFYFQKQEHHFAERRNNAKIIYYYYFLLHFFLFLHVVGHQYKAKVWSGNLMYNYYYYYYI